MTNPEALGGRPPQEGTQGELKLPGVGIKKELTGKEVVEKTSIVLSSYAQKTVEALYLPVRRGESKQVIASVPGRPEDEQLAIDALGEPILTGLIRDNQIPSFVFGEHNDYNLGNGDPQAYFTIDSFDNTSQYKRGLDTSVYSVVSGYDKEGHPLGTAIADIKARKTYLSINGENFLMDFETGERKGISKSERMTIKDPQATIATYDGSNEYSTPFQKFFGQMIKDMAPKGIKYGGGGSYIYGLLAVGAIDAYVMFNEPYSEIFPGLPIAKVAGCTIVSVDMETGQWEELKFDPERMRANPEMYKSGTIPLFIAAATPEIRDEVIRYYLEAKKENEVQAELNKLKDAFIGTRSLEFDSFRASQQPQNP